MIERKSQLLAISYAAFAIFGLSMSPLGVAWPYMRRTFGAPLDALGTLLAVLMMGYLVSSFNSGRIVARLGTGRLLLLSASVAGLGVLAYGLAPSWGFMILVVFVSGLGCGLLDAGLNTYAAIHFTPRDLNWLHASFGLGATIGPIVMTATMFSLGWPWQYGFVIIGSLWGLLAACFALTLGKWQLGGANPDARSGASAPRVSARATLALPAVWLLIALFMVSTGIETTASQWTYTLFTEGRAVSPYLAGLSISIFWGSYTAGRLLVGFLAGRIRIETLLRACTLGLVAGSLLLWVGPGLELNLLGLALMGLALGPVFPSLISVTPGRAGAHHAPNAIGFQVSAASLGGALLPALAGVLAEYLGLDVIGAALVVASLVMLVLYQRTANSAGAEL